MHKTSQRLAAHKPNRDEADEPRWLAVQRRDRSADGQFLYGVRTTGIYCRPSCGARLPLRANVVFFATGAAAEAAGFRPCRRCRPDGMGLEARRSSAIARACRLIEQSQDKVGVDALAAAAGMSRFHFQRVFKATTGLTPKAYAAAARRGRVTAELQSGGRVTDAIYAAGYGSSSRFYSGSGRELGMRPSDLRAGGRGVAMRFAVGQCSLGSILVAATDRGLCAILMGDEPDGLVRDLQDRFPRAALEAGDTEFERWMSKVVGFVDAPRLGLELPLDIRGTAFQQRVWRALREIPPGTTMSYAEIAARLGAPGSARAVARACAANPLAVAIPCHRVVRKDGDLSGYRWGVERKRALLERERA